MATPNWAALGPPSKPRLDYAKREAGHRVRWERADRRACVYPLDQLRGLPDVTDDSGAGVYFMWHGPALIYVGESGEIATRMTRHNKRRSRTTWLAVSHDAIRKGIEADHVRRYIPRLNLTRHG